LPSTPLLGWAALAVGLLLGPVVAGLSVRLPHGADARPSLRRVALFSLAAPALAAWSLAVSPTASGVVGAMLAWQLLLVAALDAEHFWLPRLLTLPLVASGLLAAAARGLAVLQHHAIGAAAGFAILWLIAWVYRRLRGRDGLGGGDAYLLAGGGAWLGWAALPTVLVWGAGLGLGAALLAALIRRPLRADQPIPFGVPLALGIWLTWLYGPLGG
jgi:leader peptidase (prepilin peptidase)/N-methyltransferase